LDLQQLNDPMHCMSHSYHVQENKLLRTTVQKKKEESRVC